MQDSKDRGGESGGGRFDGYDGRCNDGSESAAFEVNGVKEGVVDGFHSGVGVVDTVGVPATGELPTTIRS